MPDKFRAEITGVRENVWSTNAMKFDTEEEAKSWALDLSSRWTGMDAARVVPDSTPLLQEFNSEDPAIVFNCK